MSNSTIFTGLWIDHSRNPALGATITLTSEYGDFIVSALTILVTLAGTAAWSITAYTLHQVRTGHNPQSAFQRQIQVVLRNAGGAFDAALQILMIGGRWRKSVRSALAKALAVAIFPLFIFAAFFVAGLFVGRLTIPAFQAKQVLLRSENCGVPVPITGNDADSFVAALEIGTDGIRQSRAYAQQCYHAPDGAFGCATLPVQRLPYTANQNFTCPIADRCVFGPTGALRLETDLLDTHHHLGINAPSKNRVQFRVATTCSVIDVRNLTESVPDPRIPGSNTTWKLYQVYLGPFQGMTNLTFAYDEINFASVLPYTVSSVADVPSASDASEDELLPEFNLSDAQLSLHFQAANGVRYTGPTLDPWFQATDPSMNISFPFPATLYAPDRFFSTMACADQAQLCNPGTGSCSNFTAVEQLEEEENDLSFNAQQVAAIFRLTQALEQSNTFRVVDYQNGDALLASSKLIQTLSGPLPDDQWQLEIKSWFETKLANVQFRMVDFPINQWSASSSNTSGFTIVLPYNTSDPADVALNDQCSQQRVKSTAAYESFSFLGILIVVVISIALIATSPFLDLMVSHRRDRMSPSQSPNGTPGRNRHKRLAYIADGKLQLLRLALQGAGYESWEDCHENIPLRHVVGSQGDIGNIVETSDDLFYPLSDRDISQKEESTAYESLAHESPADLYLLWQGSDGSPLRQPGSFRANGWKQPIVTQHEPET